MRLRLVSRAVAHRSSSTNRHRAVGRNAEHVRIDDEAHRLGMRGRPEHTEVRVVLEQGTRCAAQAEGQRLPAERRHDMRDSGRPRWVGHDGVGALAVAANDLVE